MRTSSAYSMPAYANPAAVQSAEQESGVMVAALPPAK
jgi:hypothetical protein